jgi:hypothetical protein
VAGLARPSRQRVYGSGDSPASRDATMGVDRERLCAENRVEASPARGAVACEAGLRDRRESVCSEADRY